jgi:recombination protein RecT
MENEMNQVSITDELVNLAKPFDKQNSYDLAFESECLFAKQQITKNDFTLKTATNNPGSLRNAILNVAAIGISLNPAAAHAYLVPRDGMVCLDISYRGLVKLATDAGSIEWAKAVLVYEGDTFQWRGPTQEPLHEADVFDKDRINAADPLQNLKGGYCLAKLSTGEYMVEVMTAGEILEVKNTSKAQNGPWKGRWAGEMAKKTLVKRAYKSWPRAARSGYQHSKSARRLD